MRTSFQSTEQRARAAHRRGISSVLAMMFLVIFASLAVAMAVVAQGNLRTAHSSIKVNRAMSAAETGLIIASRRLSQEGSRFVITKGNVDTGYADDLWQGTYPNDGSVTVLPASGYPDGYTPDDSPDGLLAALYDSHLAYGDDSFQPDPIDATLPSVDTSLGILRTQAIRLTTDPDAPFFRLKYEILATDPAVRVTAEGHDGDVTRTLSMDFYIEKKIEYAVLSPNRIMIGKNVRVDGPLGSRYGLVSGELDNVNSDPLVMRSDFYYLDPALDTKLDTLYAAVLAYDVDGDNRLRVDHPDEQDGLTSQLIDYDGNEYVDDFDLFLDFFDTGPVDHRVSYGAGAEFDVDDQLAELIDSAHPDRDGDGVVGDANDTALGYMDGYIDALDLYAKVRGRLAFAVARDAWEGSAGQGGTSFQAIVQGPVCPSEREQAPVAFEVPDEELLEITTAMLDSHQSWFASQANDTFGEYDEGAGTWDGQVGTQISSGGTYIHPGDAGHPGYESVPYGAEGAYDYYERPIFQDMTFTNVIIPKGLNALFENCIFVGVTFIETNEDCSHQNWNYAGALEPQGSVYVQRFPDLVAESGGVPIPDTRVESNNIRFHDCTFLGSVTGNKPSEYTHWRNKVQMTGTTRFYIDAADPDLATQSDQAQLISLLSTLSSTEITELEKSSILLPGWSVDIGSFNNDPEKVKLKGVIVAGILDARGAVDVHGTLLMTFRPTAGAGPLFYGGQTDSFNTTIGYFGPNDGDGEGLDPTDPSFGGYGEISLRYNPDAILPDGIPWPVQVNADPLTYIEGGSL